MTAAAEHGKRIRQAQKGKDMNVTVDRITKEIPESELPGKFIQYLAWYYDKSKEQILEDLYWDWTWERFWKRHTEWIDHETGEKPPWN